MNLKEVIRSDNVNFTGIESSYFLLGLLSAFENRFQAMADSTCLLYTSDAADEL